MKFTNKIGLCVKWWNAWRTLPVLAWVRAAALYREGRYQEAIGYYRTGLRKHINHPARLCAALDLSYCLFRVGQVGDAIDELRSISPSHTTSREVYLRLCELYRWIGKPLEAAWTMRRALKNIKPDGELVGLFMLSLLENGGPYYLLTEAVSEAARLSEIEQGDRKLRVARAKLKLFHGESDLGRQELEQLVIEFPHSREVVLALSELLVTDGKISLARHHLKKLVGTAAENPRVLSMLAESYLKSGPFYQCEYAVQLSVSACQRSNWLSTREMHILAESYYHVGDKILALLIASKAKDEVGKLVGSYRHARNLDRLISDLSTGTQA